MISQRRSFRSPSRTTQARFRRNRRLGRTQFAELLGKIPQSTIVMEACGSAHFWARRMQVLSHTPTLLPAHAVQPYVDRNKTDRADTKGMLEAHRNESIRPAPVKTVAQQALCSLHRIRAGWIAQRTARINTLRGLLREFGIIIPVGAQHGVPNTWLHIEDAESEIPDSLRPALAEICTEVRELGTSVTTH